MAGKAVEIKDDNFADLVENAEGVALVDFWAEWCGPCRIIGPHIEQLAEDFDGKALVGKLDVDHNPEVSMKFGVRSIPTVLIFKDGQLVDKVIGANPKSVYESKIQDALTPA